MLYVPTPSSSKFMMSGTLEPQNWQRSLKPIWQYVPLAHWSEVLQLGRMVLTQTAIAVAHCTSTISHDAANMAGT